MMRARFAVLVLLLAGGAALADDAGERAMTSAVLPLGYCQLTVSSTAVLLSSCTGGIPDKSAWVQIIGETAAIRYRADGVAPTASVGMPLATGTPMQYTSVMAKLQFIAQTGTATVDADFYTGSPAIGH